MVGGFERVFELGKNFRNEDIDTLHNPESEDVINSVLRGEDILFANI